MSDIEKLMRDMEAEINALRAKLEIAEAEVARLTEEREDFYIQTTALRARVQELEGQHKGLVIQNRLLRQRPDLPVDRIPVALEVEALRAKLEKAKEALRPVADFATVIDEAERSWGGAPSPDEKAIHGTLTVGTFRNAAATLKEIDT